MISVIMPVYNAGKFLSSSIESILNQDYRDFELIIVNDGSTDNSEEIVLNRQDERIRYFKKPNGGESSARNFGLREARGEFVVWQDADDLSLPNRLSILHGAFTRDSIGFVHSDMLLINEKIEPIGYFQSQQITKDRLMRFFLKVGTPFNNASMMVRSKIIQKLEFDTNLKIGPDTDMVFRFTSNCESVHIEQPLYLYRKHSFNVSSDSDSEEYAKHVRLFLERHTLEELVPETDSPARATAIIALLLLRRGMIVDAQYWFDKACSLSLSDEDAIFVKALGCLMIKKWNDAYYYLTNIPRDAVCENYLGEAFAYSDHYQNAYQCFMNALLMKPNYLEPVDNLRALGGGIHLNLVDNSWMKFKVGK